MNSFDWRSYDFVWNNTKGNNQEEIIKDCIGTDFIRQTLLNQAYVNQTFILFYLHIVKTDNKYILNIKDIRQEMDYLKVCTLLPRASYINETRHFVPEEMHCLEYVDILHTNNINEIIVEKIQEEEIQEEGPELDKIQEEGPVLDKIQQVLLGEFLHREGIHEEGVITERSYRSVLV